MYGVNAGMEVLDAGCGTGIFTVEMARMLGSQGACMPWTCSRA